jgi:AraC-like DNA-binding protein
VRPLVSGLRVLGYDAAPIMREVGIDAAILDKPDAPVPMSSVVLLIARAVETTGDANLGLHLAECAELESFDVHLYAMLSSPTLGAAYERLCRYQRLINDRTRVELEVRGEQAVLRHSMPGGLPAPRQSVEFVLAAWVRSGRVATGQHWRPIEVRFAHPEPPDSSHHARFFDAPIRFSTGENTLVLPAASLELPCKGSNPGLLSVLDRYAADRLELVPRSESVADRARTALATEILDGEPSASALARRLRMSVRTLNRSLAAEGTTYRKLLDQLRCDLATRHLADDRVSISEVAFLLGFSDISAFHRAFRRWTGRTPAAFRAALHRA